MKRLLLAVLLALSIAAPVSAKADTSITVNPLTPHFGDTVTFTIVIDKNKDCTGKAQCGFVYLSCYQLDANLNQVQVYGEGYVTIAEARDPGFVLYSPDWALAGGGPATCTAVIRNLHFGIDYASTTFDVAA